VNGTEMFRTVLCESSASSTIQSRHLDPTGPNGREDSWGLAQIHLPSHPSVSREMAQDPDFALEFMAMKFAKGKQKLWTCYKNESQ